jgi:hypothetical protein
MVKKTPVVDMIDEGIALQGDYYLNEEERKYIDDEREKNKTINICFDNFTSVKNIVERMEFYLKKVSNKVYIDCNSNKPVDNFYFNNKFKNNYLDYNERILQKYLIK